MNYSISQHSFIARIAAWKLKGNQAAIVLGNTIYLYNISAEAFRENERWWRHELKHVEQFRQYGFIRFIFLYLWESILNGYTRNKFEIEAREAENDPACLPAEASA